MATAKKPAAGAKKASPAKSKSSAAGSGRATARGRGAGAAAKSATKSAAKGAAKGAAKSASKSAAKGAAKSAAKAASKSAAKGAAKSASKAAGQSAKAPAKTHAGKRGPNPAFMKPLQPDAQLAAVVGQEPMPRTQVVARVWEYIKKNGLQESRNINADEKLRPIFGKDQITMFEMMKLVNAHLSDASAK
jgi:chromatin remodeling complex protein RSC6